MDKTLSRKDAKPSGKDAKKIFFAPSSTTLRLCVKPLLVSLLIFWSLPALAQKSAVRFDPDGSYVRRYVPELRGVHGSEVHTTPPLN